MEERVRRVGETVVPFSQYYAALPLRYRPLLISNLEG